MGGGGPAQACLPRGLSTSGPGWHPIDRLCGGWGIIEEGLHGLPEGGGGARTWTSVHDGR